MSVDLELDHLEKIFVREGEPFRAVNDLSLKAAAGELITLLGPSGCGKTTTLRMVAGFEAPSAGRIRIGGEDVTGVPVNRRDIGFVFQNYALFPHMSVFENVSYGLRMRKVLRKTVRSKVLDALALVGLEGAEERFPNQLSGGEQQRVALARVLVLEPRLLLMDEPLSNLDAKLRVHMRTEIRRIQKHLGITCLYVTHDQREALSIADRIAVMNAGGMEQLGTPFEIYGDPRSLFVADFIGRANVLSGIVKRVDGAWIDVSVLGEDFRIKGATRKELVAGERAAVIIHPENVCLSPVGEEVPVSGIVRSSVFVGDRMEYRIELPSGEEVLASMPFRSDMNLITEGMRVSLRFDETTAVALPCGMATAHESALR